MADQNWAQAERHALCDLLAETGPDAPTLCEGWTTGDLAAHLLTRERRPDAAAGGMVPFLSGYSERVRRQVRERTPFRRLPLEITMADPGGRTQRLTKGGRQVRVHGLPSELTLWTAGRKDAARVELTGEAEAVNVLSQARWTI
jgi:hypothetical protein